MHKSGENGIISADAVMREWHYDCQTAVNYHAPKGTWLATPL